MVFGAFGTSNTFSKFGDPHNTLCNSNGGSCPTVDGGFSNGMGPVVNGVGGKNRGLAIAKKGFSSAFDGPFQSTLPNRNDPNVGFRSRASAATGRPLRG